MPITFNKGDRVYIIQGPNNMFCPNPDRIGETVTIDEPSQVPNFYFLEEFPGLWPAAFLLPVGDE